MINRNIQHKPIDLQRLAAVLKDIVSIEYAMVFGSSANGIVRAGSDLDVAISLSKMDAQSIDSIVEIMGKIEETFIIDCDLTLLNTAGPVLRHEALKGRVLFIRDGREDDFADFYVRTCAEYEDLMAWRTLQLSYRGYQCRSMVL